MITLEKVEQESNDHHGQRSEPAASRRDNESDDDFMQRVGRDEAGGVLLKKRQIIATALCKLGNRTQEEVRDASAEILVILEEAYDFGEYVAGFHQDDILGRWGPLVFYWDSLRRSEVLEKRHAVATSPGLSPVGDGLPF